MEYKKPYKLLISKDLKRKKHFWDDLRGDTFGGPLTFCGMVIFDRVEQESPQDDCDCKRCLRVAASGGPPPPGDMTWNEALGEACRIAEQEQAKGNTTYNETEVMKSRLARG